MGLSVKLLGQFEIRGSSGAVLSLPTRKTRALLGFLTIHADEPQPRERLMSLLWSDRGDKQARQSLNHSLRAIRKLAEQEDITLIESDGEMVTLRSDALDSDVARFRQLLEDQPGEAADLYTGPFLDALSISDHTFEEWLRETQSQYHTQACDALKAAATSGDIDQRIDRLRRLLALDPLREEAHRQLMQLLHQSDDRTGALRQYQECADILNSELQVEPHATTKALYEEIRSDEGVAAPKDIKLLETAQATSSPQDSLEPVNTPNPQEISGISKIPRRWLIGVVAVLMAVTGGLAISLMTQTGMPNKARQIAADPPQELGATDTASDDLPLPEIPSIAVLPFTNLSDEQGQEYFVDGMVDDLITDLSKVSNLFVIARNSTFTYKGKAVKVQKIAKDLGVRYVVEGSVRRAGDKVRINVQLIDAIKGHHLWAERYDGILADLFDLQDQITGKVVTALVSKLVSGEENTGFHQKETNNPQAYDEFLKGWEQHLERSPEGFRLAIKHFNNAIAYDSDYSRAYAALAATYWEVRNRYWHREIGIGMLHDALNLAETMLDKALENPTPLALQISAMLNSRQGFHTDAIADAERAVALDPNDADGYVTLASVLTLAGEPEKAIELIRKAMRLNPYFPSNYLLELGVAHYILGQYSKSADALERASALSPEDSWPTRLLFTVYGQMGRKSDIDRLTSKVKRYYFGFDEFTIKSVAFWYPFKKSEHAEKLAEGLRKAGIPD